MTDTDREECIAWLVMRTGWQREAFTGKSDRELIDLYERYMRMG